MSSAFLVPNNSAQILTCKGPFANGGAGLNLSAVFAEPRVVGNAVDATQTTTDVVRSFIAVNGDCDIAADIVWANKTSRPNVTAYRQV